MLIVISPAKTLDFITPYPPKSQPMLIEESTRLIDTLKSYSPEDLGALMKLSPKLSTLNVDRYQKWTPEGEKSALMAFKGDVYRGLDAASLSEEGLRRAQSQLRILSGLYGVLKPLDGIDAHRLEMGTRLKTERGSNLYQFWQGQLTTQINEASAEEGSHLLLNLASNEYFKSIKTETLKPQVITPVFQDEKAGTYKVISMFAKRARGLMSRFVLEEEVVDRHDLERFNVEGYVYNQEGSTERSPLYRRPESARL